MSYESLQADEIIAAVGRLKQRIEDLTTGLARKLWQKIMVLHSFETSARP